MKLFSKLFRDAHDRSVRVYAPIVAAVNRLESEYAALSNEALHKKTVEFKRRINEGEKLDAVLPEAFAAVRSAAARTLNQRHYDVQLIGGIALHQGKIAEMKTGEGKTLVATLPLYLNALTGKGVSLVTPNDYLSKVGAGWMGPVYTALGVTVGVVTHDFSGVYDPEFTESSEHGDDRLCHFRPVTRREAYAADITYGTNNEFGFDYLRDNLEYDREKLRQREPHYAIVDEIDSILIDEARTPLIISAPDAESADLYRVFSRIIPQLKEGADYNVDEKLRAVTITEEGINKIEKILGIGNIYEERGMRFVRHLEQALRAEALYHRDRDYVVTDGQVIIVDEFTGRLMPGRRWSEGLHQAVEAKEGVQVQQESRTLATVTFQNFFRMYPKLAGMTGTAETSAEEFHKVYGLDVVSIPTHKPVVRLDSPDQIFRTEQGRFDAVVREVRARHQKGQPVLIGTVSIEKNERLSKMLSIAGIPHEVLNAKNHEREALIIAQAGRKSAVTVATNMAGRGVDIILGGNPPVVDEANRVRGSGGLMVIGTERHEARRIDNQLRGRAGRQGDSGCSQFFVSLDDDLMRVFGSTRIKNMMESMGIPEDQPIENRMVSKAIEAAQAKIEGFHFDSRKHVLEYDDVLSKQRDAIYRMRREILLDTPRGDEGEIASRVEIFSMLTLEVSRLVEFHTESDRSSEWNIEELFESVRAITDVPDTFRGELTSIVSEEKSEAETREAITSYIIAMLRKHYDEKLEHVGDEAMRNIERVVLLRAIDMLWMDHLDQMEHLRDSVRLRAYGQRDPLIEYKHEGSRLFRQLNGAIRTQVVTNIFKVGGAPRLEQPSEIQLRRPDVAGVPPSLVAVRNPVLSQVNSSESLAVATAPRPKAAERNAPCPCGSGKKYKRCHGK